MKLFVVIIAAVVLSGIAVIVSNVLFRQWAGTPLACARCGYSIRGLRQLTCPECGSNVQRIGSTAPAPRVRALAVCVIGMWTLITGLMGLYAWPHMTSALPQQTSRKLRMTLEQPRSAVYRTVHLEGTVLSNQCLGGARAERDVVSWSVSFLNADGQIVAQWHATDATNGAVIIAHAKDRHAQLPFDAQRITSWFETVWPGVEAQRVRAEIDALLAIVRSWNSGDHTLGAAVPPGNDSAAIFGRVEATADIMFQRPRTRYLWLGIVSFLILYLSVPLVLAAGVRRHLCQQQP